MEGDKCAVYFDDGCNTTDKFGMHFFFLGKKPYKLRNV
jgi:hypothetical protein